MASIFSQAWAGLTRRRLYLIPAAAATMLMMGENIADAEEGPPSPCEAEAFRAFDFWLGDWAVYKFDTNEVVGENRISSLHDGCALLESWTGADGSTGTSLTYFDPVLGKWVQNWVSGSYGGYALALEGNPETAGRMVLSGQGRFYARSTSRKMRITWESSGDNGLIQTFEGFDPSKDAWTVEFKAKYVRM